jgi:hypothetical protein
MIQFNLLPDIKLQYIRTQRIKRLITSISILVTVISVLSFGSLLAYTDVYQSAQLTHTNKEISLAKKQLSSNTNLNKILTIQNQLESLPALDAQKPVVSRLFNYLQQLTPSTATIASVNIDYGLDTVILSGSANSMKTINQYVDTIKFTNISKTKNSGPSNTPAFSNVVLSNFQVQNGGASYTITFSFNPIIFNVSDNTHLVIPQITTTRSILGQPTNLFNNISSSVNSLPTTSSKAINSSGSVL